jgi:hypothetical protein
MKSIPCTITLDTEQIVSALESVLERVAEIAARRALSSYKAHLEVNRPIYLSMVKAARIAKCRNSRVLDAVRSGELPGKFVQHGKSLGKWKIKYDDLVKWAAQLG